MKRFVFLSMFVLIPILIFAQGETAPPVEIFCVTEDLPSSPIMTFTMTAMSERWDVTSSATYPPQAEHYFLTNDYEEETYVPTGNNLGQNSAGFEFVGLANAGYPTVALGLYKFTNNLNNKYFYIDYRDYRAIHYVYYAPSYPPHSSIDIWIKYRHDKDSLYYSSSGASNDFHNISNGQLLNIWDIKQKGTQKTSLFPDYWDNCLALIDDGNDHPKIVWGPYPNDEFSVSYYKIYKKKGTQNYVLYDTTTDTEYTDTQETIVFGPPVANETVAKYKVTAFGNLRSSSTETDPSNEVEARIEGNPPEKIKLISGSLSVNNFLLEQNYPNPFNPATIINYSIPENSFVTLKVYDILGKVVGELVNESKEAGNYKVSFDASELSSGLYFYTLKANGYSDTKKMILTK